MYKFSEAREKFRAILEESCTTPVRILYKKRIFELKLVQESDKVVQEFVHKGVNDRLQIAKEALKTLDEQIFVEEAKEKCYGCNLVKEVYKTKRLRDKTVSICKECYEVEVCV